MIDAKKIIKNCFYLLISITISLFVFSNTWAGNEITVYTANDVDEMEAWVPVAQEATGLKINWSPRFSTMELWARVEAEAPNFQADMIWNYNNSMAMISKEKGYSIPYKSPVWADIPQKFKDPDGHWYGFNFWFTAIVVNKTKIKEKNLPVPKSWLDLSNPVYKGEIIMPNPGTSGTAFLVVSTIMQIFGEEKGWDFLEKLDKNVAQYTRSGSAPAQSVALGEYALGISWDQAIFGRVKQGYPIDGIIPAEGTAYNLASISILKGCKNLENAKKLIDWIGTKEAQTLIGKYRSKVVRPGVTGLVEFDPKLIKYDSMWSALNQKRIMQTWKDRFMK